MSYYDSEKSFVNYLLKLFLDAFPARKTARDFMLGNWQDLRHVRQRRTIHHAGDIIPNIQKNAPKPADRFLRTAFVARDGNAINRC